MTTAKMKLLLDYNTNLLKGGGGGGGGGGRINFWHEDFSRWKWEGGWRMSKFSAGEGKWGRGCSPLSPKYGRSWDLSPSHVCSYKCEDLSLPQRCFNHKLAIESETPKSQTMVLSTLWIALFTSTKLLGNDAE